MGRPFQSPGEMFAVIQKNFNNLIAPKDKLIIVGDLCYQKSPQWLEYISQINGEKTLIRGNHDAVFTDEQFKEVGVRVVAAEGDGIELGVGGVDCFAVHYPTRGKTDRFNLVGHIHGAWRYQLNAFNVGIDVNHFRPVDFDTIPFHFNAVSKFYDADVWASYHMSNMCFIGKRGKPDGYFKGT